MADLPLSGIEAVQRRFRWRRLIASRRFQIWAARTPLLRRIARAEGAALFDLVAGFVNAQVLMALVELRVLHLLTDAPRLVADLAAHCNIPAARMHVLLQAGAGLGLLRRQRDGQFSLSLRGAAMLGVPGLEGMIRHHRALYADLADPVDFFRNGQDTDLARFWPYVFGANGAVDPEVTATYSGLMAESQQLVAEDTLRVVDLHGVRHLMDVGGGTGAFLSAAKDNYPLLDMTLFDLPVVVGSVVPAARMTIHPGSFRDDPLPQGADAISLIRVLYDHDDATVSALLARIYAVLPVGGRLIISEPMSGGAKPDRVTDVYFAVYTLAMRTGRTRSATEILGLLTAAGFTDLRAVVGFRPFVTSVITARKTGV